MGSKMKEFLLIFDDGFEDMGEFKTKSKQALVIMLRGLYNNQQFSLHA